MSDYSELLEQISDEADLCRNDGADDIAGLLDEAAAAIRTLLAERHAPIQDAVAKGALPLRKFQAINYIKDDADLKAYAEVHRQAGWNEAIEAAWQACFAEHLGDPQDETDDAYDRGVEHCVNAVRALKP